MKKYTNEEILERLEATIKGWKGQFDNPPDITLSFSVSAADKLLLNGLELCDMAEIEPEALHYDVEVLDIGPVWLLLDWPYNGKPRLFMEREVAVA
jgi:hypothetical protein